MRTFLSSLLVLVAGASASSSFSRLLQDCGQSCDNNGGCQNGSTCNLNSVHCVWCSGCPDGYTGDRCETAPATSGCGQTCANNGTNKDGTANPCQNGSTCNLNADNCVYCSNCPTGYTGDRCETAPAATGCGQTCANNGTNKDGTANPCQNGSTCNLNADNCVYCSNCPQEYSGERCEIGPICQSSQTQCGLDPTICCTGSDVCQQQSSTSFKCGPPPALNCTANEQPCGHSSGPVGHLPDTYCCPASQQCSATYAASGEASNCVSNFPCASDTCKNGGTCNDVLVTPGQPAKFTSCTCTGGHTGMFCEN